MLLANGRVLLPINYGEGRTVIFDPATDICSVTTPVSAAGMFGGGALLADGSVLLLPGLNTDLMECRIWDAEADAYGLAPELSTVPAIGQGAYLGGCVLPDGRVVRAVLFTAFGRVGSAVGASCKRDVALSGFLNRWP